MSDAYLTYPYEVRTGVIAELRLPIGLTRTEAERVAAFVMTLALKGDESEPPSKEELQRRLAEGCGIAAERVGGAAIP